MKTPKPTIIAASDVPRVFSDANLWRMAKRVEYAPAELPVFTEAVREALLSLLQDLARPTSNQVHHEIDKLVRAAVRATKARKQPGYWCERVADLRERLSAPAQKILNRRDTLPDPATLRDPVTQLDACHAILSRARLGIRHREGRTRGEGARSVTEVPELYAPLLEQRPLRHEPLMVFVERLENAELRATGDRPRPTANFYHPGDFAKFLQACLNEAGIVASAIKLLEERHRRRRRKNLDHWGRRWDAAANDLVLRLARARILGAIHQRYRLSHPNR